MSNNFIETKTSQQKLHHYNIKNAPPLLFPTVLAPSPSLTTISLVTNSISKTDKPFIESLLHNTGAVLFRGCNVHTASDFNDFVEAFGYEELAYVGAARRTHVVGRVFTGNEAPADQSVPFHHEMARFPEPPSKLFFFCEVEPSSGGETPVVLSHIVYEKMKHKYPDFIAELEQHGLLDTRIMPHDDDPSSPIGHGWKSMFETEDRSVAEERAAKQGMKLEWSADGGAKAILGPVAAIKYDKSRNRKVWFNSIAVGYTGRKMLTLGNNKPLPDDIMNDCLKILEEESVSIPWKEGDVLLIDNLAVLHARMPCYSPRRVLVSLCR